MTSTFAPPASATGLWRTALDIESQSADHYKDNVNRPLLELIDGSPRRVLELGCAAGHCGEVLKARYPGVYVVGIDANRAAAQAAERRLDRVVCGRLEDIDFEAQGIERRSFDTVIVADILEHLVNPWRVLEQLATFMTPAGQILVSLPNVRNLTLLADALQNGRWTYQPQGLLDITHLRFFTLTEMRLMFQETGFRPDKFGAVISRNLNDLYNANRQSETATIQFGRLTLANVTSQELLELCAEQFLFRCRALSAPAS